MTMKNNILNNRANAETHDDNISDAFAIIVRSSEVELTKNLREAVARKIGRVRQYAPRAFRARVHFERDHTTCPQDQYRVTVRYEIPGYDLMVEHRSNDPFAALDLVSEKIERRLRKRKTARLAKRVGRQARACRIADYCGVEGPDETSAR